jgi:UDP-N-acetylglucosamine 2-epimerase (non-hydrolysing)
VRSPHLIVCNPLGYLDFLRILTSSAVVLTDSGGVQEEALTLRVPCLTLRENTERPETVLARGNKLVGTQPELIKSSVVEILTDRDKAVSAIARQNPLGDGKAGARITDLCIDYAVGVPFEDGLRDREMIGITAVTVRAPYDGMTVAELRERMGRVITMVYDGLGQPIFPREDICLEEGWTVCLLGNLPGLRPTSQIMRDVKRVRLDGERRC